MKTIELDETTEFLAEYARSDAEHRPVILTANGRPYAALIPYEDFEEFQDKPESLSPGLTLNKGENLRSYLRRVRARYDAEGGIPLEDLEREYGLTE